MLHFLETTAPATSTGMDMLTPLLMMGIIFVAMWLIMIRPENKRKKEAEAMRNAVKVGDKITTIGGIVGTVVNVKDDKIVIETSADQVRVEFCKWAISSNETAAAAAEQARKKEEEARARAKAAKKAKKDE